MPRQLARALTAVTAPLLAACAGARRAPETPRPAAAVTNAVTVVTSEDVAYLRERALVVPVAGVRARDLRSTFDAPRDGGARLHAALDIMAPRGTPVLSADAGRVWKLRANALGGLTIYAADPGERFVYYYAHLDAYRPGLAEGAPLARGDTIGFVGTTGNAPPDVPHLHFQVSRVAAPGQWWGGVPVDPTALLGDMADTTGRSGVKVRKDGG